MILEKITTARGTLFIYIFTGSLWYLLTHFLPDNRWRDIFTIGLAFLFCGIFMWSLFSTLQRIYGDDGNLWKELAMTTLNVFLFLLTFRHFITKSASSTPRSMVIPFRKIFGRAAIMPSSLLPQQAMAIFGHKA